SSASASRGPRKDPMRLRSSTTTEAGPRKLMVRIPTDRSPTHPGEMLFEEFLKPLGLSQTELAERLGVSYPRVNELVHGKRDMTPDTALRLERLLCVQAQFWLTLQLAWDLYHAAHSPAAREHAQIKRIKRAG